MSDGFFRQKGGYTVVQNVITKDKSVSLKAKGLYLVIQAHITMPDKMWRKTDFLKMALEGPKAFDSAWNELKDHGFLKVHMIPKGNKWSVEYELKDVPELGAHTFYYNSKGELSCTNIDRANTREEKKANVDLSGIQNEYPSILCQKGSNAKGINASGVYAEGINAEGVYAEGSNAEGVNADGYNENGDNGKGYDANGGINNNTCDINPNDNNCEITPSFFPSNSTEAKEGRTPALCVVALDDTKRLQGSEWAKPLSVVQEKGGIPYSMGDSVADMKSVILVMSGWNGVNDHEGYSDIERHTFRVIVENLIEMATAKNVMTIKDYQVTNRDVIDQINILYHRSDSPIRCLYEFIFRVIKRYREATVDRLIKNPKLYLVPMIWESFAMHDIGFDSEFSNAYGGKYS